jgi:TnpA family transposase
VARRLSGKSLFDLLGSAEALHELRHFLFFGQAGLIRKKSEEALADQALCLSLPTSAVVVWNTLPARAGATATTVLI